MPTTTTFSYGQRSKCADLLNSYNLSQIFDTERAVFMKTVGIIAEYNPLHNGHQYQIGQAKTLTGADYVIVVMSGDFVQRGEPAIYDKYTRTRMALNAGADLVLELPSCFAIASAEDFASCGVSLLDQLGVVDHLCFGSECGNVEPLKTAAEILAKEPDEYKEFLKNQLAEGAPFPKARAQALTNVMFRSGLYPEFDWNKLISSPNNILGIEYIKALIRMNSRIQPVTVLRSGNGYHDINILDDAIFASASAIRKALMEGDPDVIRRQIPYPLENSGLSNQSSAVFADDISEILNFTLLDLNHKSEDFTLFSDVSKELSDRLSRQILDFDTFSGRIQSLKTKQYTYTRISRALLHILLGIQEADMKEFRSEGYAFYARVLGFKKQALPLLSEFKAKSRIPLISKVANAEKILAENPLARKSFQYDMHASHLYQMIQFQKSGIRSKNEFTNPVIIKEM